MALAAIASLAQEAPSQSAPAQDSQIEGRNVTRISVVDASGKNVSERIPPLPLQRGKAFDFSVERETLRKLYAMGDFSDIHVTTTNAEDGVAVTAGQFVSASDISAGGLLFTPAANASGTAYAGFTFQVQNDFVRGFLGR